MPLFGANDATDSASPDTFNPLTARVLRDMKIVMTLFYTQSSTVWREATVTRQILGRAEAQALKGKQPLRNPKRIRSSKSKFAKGIPQLWTKGLRSGNASVDLFFERRNNAVRLPTNEATSK
jgi:hypothetical protein